jgi:hypothetical protein
MQVNEFVNIINQSLNIFLPQIRFTDNIYYSVYR